MRETGHDDAVEIAQNVVERLGPLWRLGGQRRPDLARRRSRHDGIVGNVAPIVGDPVDDAMAKRSELFGGHGACSSNGDDAMYALSSHVALGVMLVRVGYLVLAIAFAGSRETAAAQAHAPTLRVIDRGRELVVEYGPLALHAGSGHAAAVEPPAILFRLPATGWMRGYVVELVDGAGRRLPQRLLHHMNLIAKNRRDLFSNVMQRLGAAGPETGTITLPRFAGVWGARGDTLVMTVMLHNPTEIHYDDVRLRVLIPFVRARSRVGAITVYPVSVAIGPKERPNVFDLPPGRSEHFWEGSPAVAARILGLSGHLHRYGVALRLEDRTARKVMWELKPRSDSAGEVRDMPVSMFLWTLGKPIRPDHVYRLTAVYDNPEGRTIRDGGMGVIGGVVVLSRGARWPAVDRLHPEYVADARAILGLVSPQRDQRVDPRRAPRRQVAGHQRHHE
jgi:hypothetical protein